MNGLEAAISARDWDRVALYLLAGIMRALEKVPAGSLAEMLDLLSGEDVEGDRDAR